jgi:hypothetical protein
MGFGLQVYTPLLWTSLQSADATSDIFSHTSGNTGKRWFIEHLDN